MISVLTLTYQRHYLLEEAIESFLRQDFQGEAEMLIINDSPKVEYVLNNSKIWIINIKERFPSIGQKLKYGFSQCNYDYIYRLDDDDLLAPWALSNTSEDILQNPNHEIYRSNGHYFFEHNQYKMTADNTNNGNVYTKKYLSRIEIPSSSMGEDYAITFNFKANIYESPREKKTMIYRWGMNTYHISGMGDLSNTAIYDWTDSIVQSDSKEKRTGFEEGVLELRPHFEKEYYQQLPSV